jgi:hypothetical protein
MIPLYQHIKGKKHKNKIDEKYLFKSDSNIEELPNSRFKCIVCNLEINGPIPLEQHLNGKNHLKKINKFEILIENSKFDSHIEELEKSKFKCIVCNLEINGPITLEQHLIGKNHLKKINKSNPISKKSNTTSLNSNIEELENSHFKCIVCNLEINGPVPLEQHLNGKNHLKKIILN